MTSFHPALGNIANFMQSVEHIKPTCEMLRIARALMAKGPVNFTTNAARPLLRIAAWLPGRVLPSQTTRPGV